ncbi:MAG: DUF3883 domain-containing protein [Lentisphaeria bacterium]|jgi:hypothetical protein|nr:DUF3883 domain-containing protein [Lentisphaeria bacterium]
MPPLTKREKLILAGLFLAKFDRSGLAHLGFSSFAEAYNTIAASLGAPPASVKNYRDELDPFFPNPRRGWADRLPRPHCQRILDQYGRLDLAELGCLLRANLAASGDSESIGDETEGPDWSSGFASRMQTGLAAETYFTANAKLVPDFCGCQITSTTHLGCGFDFKLTQDGSPYLAVEVKGLRDTGGDILLTDKEYRTAARLRERYILFVVRGFAETPFHSVFRDPVHGALALAPRVVTRQETTWAATLGHAVR